MPEPVIISQVISAGISAATDVCKEIAAASTLETIEKDMETRGKKAATKAWMDAVLVALEGESLPTSTKEKLLEGLKEVATKSVKEGADAFVQGYIKYGPVAAKLAMIKNAVQVAMRIMMRQGVILILKSATKALRGGEVGSVTFSVDEGVDIALTVCSKEVTESEICQTHCAEDACTAGDVRNGPHGETTCGLPASTEPGEEAFVEFSADRGFKIAVSFSNRKEEEAGVDYKEEHGTYARATETESDNGEGDNDTARAGTNGAAQSNEDKGTDSHETYVEDRITSIKPTRTPAEDAVAGGVNEADRPLARVENKAAMKSTVSEKSSGEGQNNRAPSTPLERAPDTKVKQQVPIIQTSEPLGEPSSSAVAPEAAPTSSTASSPGTKGGRSFGKIRQSLTPKMLRKKAGRDKSPVPSATIAFRKSESGEPNIGLQLDLSS